MPAALGPALSVVSVCVPGLCRAFRRCHASESDEHQLADEHVHHERYEFGLPSYPIGRNSLSVLHIVLLS